MAGCLACACRSLVAFTVPWGSLLVVAVVIHVVGLWITSPPDVIDALLFRSPTPFSLWGVSAMWALFAAALLAALRSRIPPNNWRLSHMGLVSIVVVGGAIHALLIEGTMEPVSKVVLCAIAVCATIAGFAAPWLRTARRTSKKSDVLLSDLVASSEAVKLSASDGPTAIGCIQSRPKPGRRRSKP